MHWVTSYGLVHHCTRICVCVCLCVCVCVCVCVCAHMVRLVARRKPRGLVLLMLFTSNESCLIPQSNSSFSVACVIQHGKIVCVCVCLCVCVSLCMCRLCVSV